ncbi:MAG: SDR family NAD(P)-dependent oxidoreductase [Novosphingobium sp.]|nr:SDR family NAD(P)-dependent oxidoreductase [Novosphingobium sp.]MCP5403724.1 SDR family NAD(P)-dependent oxidoreductase [Novosphingobium sp.]
MTGTLSGKVALVTGASSGIGEAAALALAEAGAKLAVCARRADRLEGLVERIAAAGSEAIALPGDVTDAEFAQGLVQRTVGQFGKLDILVNSAGAIQEGHVDGANLDEWRQTIEVNLMASLYTCRAAMAVMREQGSGDIINISSTSGRRAVALFGPYCTSKFGLTAMTEGLRQEAGGQGIRVCLLEPGATSTELAGGITDPGLRKSVQELAERETSMKPQDIADAVMFVVSLPPRVNVSEMLIRPTTDVAPM